MKKGGVLVMVDGDRDPYNHVREWWNENRETQRIPRQHLFEKLGLKDDQFSTNSPTMLNVGRGAVVWVRQSPVPFALSAEADARFLSIIKQATLRAGLAWKESNVLALRRGPYLIGAGLDESVNAPAKLLKGRFVNLFDSELKVQRSVELNPNTRVFLLDLDVLKSNGERLLASACKALPEKSAGGTMTWTVEGIGDTPAVMLFSALRAPHSVQLDQQPLTAFTYDAVERLLYVRFPNEARPRNLVIDF